jgi:predicted DNA-binding transcriptional regulator AlpA
MQQAVPFRRGCFNTGALAMAIKISESLESFDVQPDTAHVPVKTVASILGVSPATGWRMVKAGKLKPKKIGERSTRFSVGEIRKLLAA